MKLCYENCIKLADEKGLTSIAFPSLGTGGHSYPIELASKLAIDSSIETLKGTKNLMSLTFVTFSEIDYNEYLSVASLKNDKEE
jgi:O-acetyl-ADP-ribose deacetylase (regulator of RNase III)